MAARPRADLGGPGPGRRGGHPDLRPADRRGQPGRDRRVPVAVRNQAGAGARRAGRAGRPGDGLGQLRGPESVRAVAVAGRAAPALPGRCRLPGLAGHGGDRGLSGGQGVDRRPLVVLAAQPGGQMARREPAAAHRRGARRRPGLGPPAPGHTGPPGRGRGPAGCGADRLHAGHAAGHRPALPAAGDGTVGRDGRGPAARTGRAAAAAARSGPCVGGRPAHARGTGHGLVIPAFAGLDTWPFRPAYTAATDSNIDWGQGLYALSAWSASHHPWIMYFGPRGITPAAIPGARPLPGTAPAAYPAGSRCR